MEKAQGFNKIHKSFFDMGNCFGCQAENLKEVFATSPCVKRLKDMVFTKVGIFSAEEKKQDLQSLKQHPIKYESYPIPNSDCCNCNGLGAWRKKRCHAKLEKDLQGESDLNSQHDSESSCNHSNQLPAFIRCV